MMAGSKDKVVVVRMGGIGFNVLFLWMFFGVRVVG